MSPPTESDLETLAASIGFSGVVRLDRAGGPTHAFASGFADRRNGVANTLGTRFATASATKGFTALTIVSMAESGDLELSDTVSSLLGPTLPHVDAAVTVEHLLGHTSGVGDYLDEEALGDIDDHVLGVSAHTLERPSDYLELLNQHRQVSAPGARFAYNNSGYVMLALIIEHLAGSFHDAVRERVLDRVGMARSGFFRSDDLPPDAAVGYLEDGRTNGFHLPVVGGGDGGIYLDLTDVDAFWSAFSAGSIVAPSHVDAMTQVRHVLDGERAYGLGFWLSPDGQTVWLEGMDAGVSFQSALHRPTGNRYTVMANTSSGAWPLVKELHRILATA